MSRENRRRCYIDRALQGPLLIGFVIFETVLFITALLVLEHNLEAALEQQIYRAHQVSSNSLPLLLNELLWVGGWLLAINVIAVWLVSRVWVQMVGRAVDPLQTMLSAVANLDLREQAGLCQGHEVLRHAEQWLQHERRRNRQLYLIAKRIEQTNDKEGLLREIRALQALLDSSQQPHEDTRVLQ